MEKRLNNLYKKARALRVRPLIYGCSILILMVAVVLMANRNPKGVNVINKSKKAQIDLISGQDWSHMAGATQTGNKVKVSPLGRAIVNQDGSGGQPNPPVNVRGPHLSFKKGFKITVGAADIPKSGAASFYLYGSVPVIYDEWRYQTPQVRVDISQDSIAMSEWNGGSDNPVKYQKWSASVGDNTAVSIVLSDKKLTVQLNGNDVGSLPDYSIFSSGLVWFGADAPVGGGGWTISSLTTQSINRSKVDVTPGPPLAVPTNDSNSLRKLSSASSRKLPIGAAVANYALFSDSQYRQLVATQFSMLTPENELKPQFVHPGPNTYSFTEADSLVDFANANGMAVHGHTLVFSEANPRWMQNAPVATRQKIMTDHITTVVRHFGPKINEWDVVNEPLSDDDETLRNNIWFAAMGEKYIDTAFNTAHTANPSAKLYVNEYGLEQDSPRWDNFLDLLRRLQARGVPIDGVGFQSHIYESGDEVDGTVLKQHIKILADMGIASRISEIDVYGDDASHQSEQYAKVLKPCLDSPSCTSFTTWGVTDKYGSTTDIHIYPQELGNDLIWDSNFKPKQAYASLQAAFTNL
jgi:endo-1,4-beta-xylanase